MKKKLFWLFPLFILFVFTAKAGDGIIKETFTYSIKGQDTLQLDRYFIPGDGIRPCVIFVFGGGFYSGKRDKSIYLKYYHFLVDKGFDVAAIDYRLGLKPLLHADKKGLKAKELLSLFENAVSIAVEDFFDATNYVLSHAGEWGIDKDRIVASGSSAGAITVLQGEYERSNHTPKAEALPEEFKYAGVISFAGAVYSNRGKPRWNESSAPLLLFHGDADRNVPYDRIRIFRFGLWGSKQIARQYKANGTPYYFHSEENVDHSLAVTPMESNLEEIGIFLDKYIVGGQPLIMESVITPMDKPAINKKFGIKDYIKSNMGL